MANEGNGRVCMAQGRIVWTNGDLFQGKVKTDMNTKQIVTDQQGQPVREYGFGLAIPKTALAQTGAGQPGEVWAAMHEEAFTLFPSRQIPPGFAMKYKDGDGVDDQGRPFAQREGYAGCIVLACTTRLPIKFFRFENGQNILINEGIKCGDYVNVQVSIKGHGAVGTARAGLYVNPQAVQFLGYGTAIVNVPSGDQIFGTSQPPMPQGASSTPLVPQGQGMLVQPVAAPQAGYAQPPMQQAPYATPVAQQPVAAHYGVLPPAHQPPMQQAPYAAPVAQQPVAAPLGGFPQPGVPTYGR